MFLLVSKQPLWEDESLGSNITQKVAFLQVKIIPTSGGKDKMEPNQKKLNRLFEAQLIKER
jgi:hypothetical protein